MLRSLLAVAVFAPIACAGSSEPACHVDADCASMMCDPVTFTCAPPNSESDSGVKAGDGGVAQDGGSVSETCAAGDAGIIDSSQVLLQAGEHATFRTATNVTVDTTGTVTDGATTWDYSGMLTGDQDVATTLESLSGQWFASAFPNATYATPIAQSTGLLGVFQVTASEVLMIGIVSPTGGTEQTELTYDPPVPVLEFPLRMGLQWQTTSTVTGMAEGVPADYLETYQMNVDAEGTVVTPYAPFPALRVNTLLTQVIGAVTTTIRQYTFVTPCFGPVATVVSEDDLSYDGFTEAAEIQRLAP